MTDPVLISRYQEALAAELPSLADRALVKHLRRLTTLASRVLVDGFDTVAREDVTAADELLTDLLAVATFHAWDLPLTVLGEQDLDCADLPRGLLGADRGVESARVWLLDGATIALSRSREAGDAADLAGHRRSE